MDIHEEHATYTAIVLERVNKIVTTSKGVRGTQLWHHSLEYNADRKRRLIMIRREIGGQGAKGFDSLEYAWKRRDLNMYVGQQRRWSKLKAELDLGANGD